MHTGMLWFDNSQSSLAAKVKWAVDYYQKKYGCKPDLCLVHPGMMKGFVQHEGNRLEIEGVAVKPYRPVLPGHLWIGMEDES